MPSTRCSDGEQLLAQLKTNQNGYNEKLDDQLKRWLAPCRSMTNGELRRFANENIDALNSIVALAKTLPDDHDAAKQYLIAAHTAIGALRTLQPALRGAKPADFLKLQYNLSVQAMTAKQVS